MSEHTPGPWTVEEYGDEDCPALVIHRDSENRVCFMATPGSHGDPAKIAADARLIAAAPDLLAAAQAQHEAIDILMAMLIEASRGVEMEPFMPSKSRVWPMLLQGNAAIAKATGTG